MGLHVTDKNESESVGTDERFWRVRITSGTAGTLINFVTKGILVKRTHNNHMSMTVNGNHRSNDSVGKKSTHALCCQLIASASTLQPFVKASIVKTHQSDDETSEKRKKPRNSRFIRKRKMSDRGAMVDAFLPIYPD
jgi:hypothetical protein